MHLDLKLRFSLTVILVLVLSLFVPSPFCAQSAERPIRVAARICPPFVMNDAGEFSGLSVFLWDNIALELGLEYSIEEYGLDEMLTSIAQGKADVGVSCLSKTHEREKIIDFSHSLSLEYLQEQGINSRTFSDRQKLLAALDAGSLGAVVADGAVLKYMIKKANAEGGYELLSVLPFEFEKQSYAFALPDHSPHVEKFNQALLAVLESPLWRKELVKYLGK